MDIRTILVNLDIDFYSPSLLTSAVGLAERWGAQLIGMAAAEPSPTALGIEAVEQIEPRLQSLETEFMTMVPASLRGRFGSSLQDPTSGLVSMARNADLVLLGSHLGTEISYSRNVDAGELVLAAGRPVLIAAAGASVIKSDKILVGWKDTREARRAVSDAMPILKTATDVMVAFISEGNRLSEKAGIEDIVAWLGRHGVKARGDVYPSHGGPAETLTGLAKWLNADLIVTGAYGHSRLREWLLGGMTRDLVTSPTTNRLMSY